VRKNQRWRLTLAIALSMMAVSHVPAQDSEPASPTEAEVACAAANLLVGSQLVQQPMDDQLSTRFLGIYLDALDAAHTVFQLSDIDEFAWFRPDLAKLTLTEGQTWPAHMIYTRYLNRLTQAVHFETNFVHTVNFQFTNNDSWPLNRHDIQRPNDPAAAQAMWRQKVRADYLREKLAGSPPTEIVNQLARRYERQLQLATQLDSADVLEIYLDAFARALDPHSEYLGHAARQEFTSELDLSLSGVGGSFKNQGDDWVVGELTPGGPAARSGLIHPGDRILAVAQDGGDPEEVTELSYWHVVNLIRGPQGSTVRLIILPAGQKHAAAKSVSLVRENINLTDGYATASMVELGSHKLHPCRMGVIQLPLFYQSAGSNSAAASVDTARLIQRLKQADVAGLILDLRRNPGGSVEEAIKLAGLFLPAGPIVQTRDATGQIHVLRSTAPQALYDGPLVVLTSRYSASSSEIVAGALQDYGRALIVGDPATFGKGTVQSIVPLKILLHTTGFGAVKVTTSEFYRPTGVATQLKGITPDIILPSETDLPGVGENQFSNALPWTMVSAAEYAKHDHVSSVLPTIRRRSEARVASGVWFRLMRDRTAALAAENSGVLSLNEAARRREIAMAVHFQDQSDRARIKNASGEHLICDFTLADGLEVKEVAAKKPAGDVVLAEAENILTDYIRLSTGTLTGGQPFKINLLGCRRAVDTAFSSGEAPHPAP
jgi:carboxyl-terminal processing protease